MTIFIALILFLGFLVILKGYSEYLVRKAEKKNPPLGQKVTVDAIEMHYLRQGSGRPVVFIHGSFGSIYDYEMSIRSRVTAYDAVFVDRPGHGYSSRPKDIAMSVFDQARYIHLLTRKLGMHQPVLVGHSFGAIVALAYALEYPDDLSGMVLGGVYVKPWNGPTNPLHSMTRVPVLGRIYTDCLVLPFGHTIKNSIGEKVFYPSAAPKDYIAVSSSLAMRPGHFRANAADILELKAGLRTMQPRWGEVQVPTAILTGDNDLVAPIEDHALPLHQSIKNSRLTSLKNTGHQPFFAAPEEMLSAIDWVWSEVDRQAGRSDH